MSIFDRSARRFFSKAEGERIVAAIRRAEDHSSGEIRVHLENHCPQEDPLNRARELFYAIGMGNTRNHNGVLIYLATKDHDFSIYADEGIDAVVPPFFWEHLLHKMTGLFKEKKFLEGIVHAIAEIGAELKHHFPATEGNENEREDGISYGE